MHVLDPCCGMGSNAAAKSTRLPQWCTNPLMQLTTHRDLLPVSLLAPYQKSGKVFPSVSGLVHVVPSVAWGRERLNIVRYFVRGWVFLVSVLCCGLPQLSPYIRCLTLMVRKFVADGSCSIVLVRFVVRKLFFWIVHNLRTV